MKSLGKDLSWELPARSAARAAEIERLEQPTESLECWRYSPVGDVDWERYQGTLERSTEELWQHGRSILASFGSFDAVVGIDGGQLVESESTNYRGDAALGIVVTEQNAESEFLREDDESPLTLGTLLAPGRVEIKVSTPLRRLGILTCGSGQDAPIWSWLRLSVAQGCEIEIVHVDLLSGSVLSLPVLEIEVADDAAVVYRHQLEHVPSAVSLGYVRFTLGSAARLELDAASAHQGYTRVRTDGVLQGSRAAATIRVGYVVGSDEHVDYRTFITHDAPRTKSDLLYKGVVAGDGASIYTGLITITPLGSGSEAFQTNRNVLLSPEAMAWSVPNLDIQISDVKCSHASTVGPIDDEQLFYLASKGFPEAEAQRTLARAFFADMGDAFAVEQLRLRAAIDEKWELSAE